MKLARAIINSIDKINKIIGDVVKFLLLYMAITLTFEVIARYVFNSPTIWAFELSKHAMCYIGALGGGYTLMTNSHVKIDVLYGSLSFKKRAIIDIITSTLFFVFIGILLWASISMAISSWELKEHASTVLGAPLYFIKAAIPIGVTLVLLQGIAKLLRDILTLVTGKEQEYMSLDS